MSSPERRPTAGLPRDRAVAEEAEPFVEQAEFGARRLVGIPFCVAGRLALAFSGFQLYTAAFGTLPGVLQRAVPSCPICCPTGAIRSSGWWITSI